MDSISIADSIKQAAEAVVQQQQSDMLEERGYVYDEHSGLYYHSATGYYYDQVSMKYIMSIPRGESEKGSKCV